MSTVYGLALDTPEFLPDPWPEGFGALAFPGGWLDTEAGKRRIRKYAKHRRIVREAFNPPLCRLIPGETTGMRLDFGVYMRETSRRIAEAGIPCGIADFDLDSALDDAGYRARLTELIQSCLSDWTELNWTLLLRLRLPGARLPEAAALLRGLLTDRVRWAVELYPHEPGFAALDPEAVWPYLAYLAPVLTFHYEAGSGNRLTPKIISPWLTRAARTGADFAVCFSPDHLGPDVAQRKIQELTDDAALRAW